MIIATLFLVLVVPLVLLIAEKRIKIISIIGPVLLCYGIGLLLGNVGINWPKTFIEENISVVAVPLAIPLLMFNSNPKSWRTLAPMAFKSFTAGVVAVVVVLLLANIIWHNKIAEASKVSAMLVGVYTGGTPNLAAIGTALNVSSETIPTLTVIDTVLCAVYLLFLLSIAEKVLGLFLKPGVKIDLSVGETYDKSTIKNRLKQGVLAFLLSAVCLGIGIGLSLLITNQLDELIILLALTILAFVFSFGKKVNALKPSYKVGEYLILVFCLAIGLLSNFSVLAGVSGNLLAFCAFVVYGSISIHLLLAKFFKLDTHHVMITSTAALFGPAFVGMVASRLKNPSLVVSGMTTGVIGYVVANILGISLYKLLEIF